MTTYATADAFLKPVPCAEVEFETKLGTIRMVELLAADYSREFADWIRPGGKLNKERDRVKWSRLVVLCMVDKDGNRLLTGDDAVNRIEQLPQSLKEKLQGQAVRLHGLIDDEEDADGSGKSDS